MKRLERRSDQALPRYLIEHRASWAKTLMEWTRRQLVGQAPRIESQSVERSDIHPIYDGVANSSEELMIHAFQSKARAGLKIGQGEKTERVSKFQRGFTTIHIKS